MRSLSFAAWGIVFVFLTGCNIRTPDARPFIHYGKDVCRQCNMIITEEPFAAAVILGDGQTISFDGIGCLVDFWRRNRDQVSEVQVHDFDSREWLDSSKAFFVYSKDILTPMADGLLAFSDRESAQAWADKNKGKLFTFEELSEKVVGGSSEHGLSM